MTFNSLSQELTAFGLTEKEADIYLAALMLGPATVQNMAKKANVNRVTTYVMIDQLTKKGLISSVAKGKKKLYIAQRPERIQVIIAEREQEVRRQLNQFTALLPELRSLTASSGNKPVVRFYEGVEGLKSIHEEIRRRKLTEYSQIMVPSLSKDVFKRGDSPARDEMFEKMKKGELSARVISVGSNPVREETYKDVATHKMRYLSLTQYPFSAEFGIYGSLVVLYMVKDDYVGILIEDEHIAKNFQVLFDIAWATSKATP